MEIMVATVIFAVVVVSLLSLFNYVLKINRRGEVLRQAAQDSRDFVELLVKEIRNGQVDYYVDNGLTYNNNYINGHSAVPCRPPGALSASVNGANTYAAQSNWLGIINTDNVQECFYLARSDGSTYVDTAGNAPLTFTGQSTDGLTLALDKNGISSIQKLNPPNSHIEAL